MNRWSAKVRRTTYAAAVGVVIAAAAGGVAYATSGQPESTAYAPYARAGARVAADGKLLTGKNIESVTPEGSNTYCVKLDPAANIDLSTAIIQATLQTGPASVIRVRRDQNSSCNNAADTVSVFTNKQGSSGLVAERAGFFISIQ